MTALSVAAVKERPESREEESESEWELDAAEVDCSVRILPGVKALLASNPEGCYAVAMSGATTYGALPLPLPPSLSLRFWS